MRRMGFTYAVPGPLVILDTNALFHDPFFTSADVGRLLALSRRARIELAVPEVVLLELQRQQQKQVAGQVDYLQKTDGKIRETLRKLRVPTDTFDLLVPSFEWLDAAVILNNLFESVRTRLRENAVEILPIPTIGHRELLTRDLGGRLPFDTNGRGYRDALIWHSIVHRWGLTPLFEDGFIVTSDDDFGKGDLDAGLVAELPFGSTPVRVSSIIDLLTNNRISSLHRELQQELETVATRPIEPAAGDHALAEELAELPHRALSETAEAAVEAAIDSLSDVALSNAQRSNLGLGREFGDLDLVSASADGGFEWSPYDQLDGDTLLGQGTIGAVVELRAIVDKGDAAVLADPDLYVETWENDAALITIERKARLTFDFRVDVASVIVADVTLSDIEAAD